MHDYYKITGGNKLYGEVPISGAKNASIKLMIAALLFDSKVSISNVPQNEDNSRLFDLFKEIGVTYDYKDGNLTVEPTTITTPNISLLTGSQIRSSFLLFGPLMHRFGKCQIPNPGGCRIGARPIERIISGLNSIGAQVTYNSDTGFYEAKKTQDADHAFAFTKPTHTGTECLILYAVKNRGTTTLTNCALEPEIDDLIKFLNNAGAKITRNGKVIIIKGVDNLHQSEPHKVIWDRNEAVTYAALAYATEGELFLKGIGPSHIQAFLEKLQNANAKYEIEADGIKFKYEGRLRAASIQTAPEPGFMTDWQPQWGLLMSKADGESVIHETLLESRLNYANELVKVGANIEWFQPDVQNPNELYQFNYVEGHKYNQAIRIKGVQKLHNGILTVHDLRAGAVCVMAALCAQGESYVLGASQVERGYENFCGKLRAIGGVIHKF